MTKRSGSLLRTIPSMSPVASVGMFESADGSDDEDNVTDNINGMVS